MTLVTPDGTAVLKKAQHSRAIRVKETRVFFRLSGSIILRDDGPEPSVKDSDLRSSPDSVRVLVVDDECAIADTLARILRNHGFETLPEYSAEGATSAAQRFSPDILVTDVVMPGLSGIDLAEWFSKERPGCQIILTSANLHHHFDPADLSFQPEQEISFLPKPVLVSDLIELLDRKRSAA